MQDKKSKTAGIDKLWEQCEKKAEEERVARLKKKQFVYLFAFFVCVICFFVAIALVISLKSLNAISQCSMLLTPLIFAKHFFNNIQKVKLMIKIF